MTGKEQWYSNKDLFNLILELQEQMKELQLEMKETATLIRDYNDLRQRLINCETKLGESQGKELGSKTIWGYVVGAFGIASFVFSIVLHFIK